MIFIKYFFLALASILADIVGVFVVPVALHLGGVDNRLPSWAQWWDNDREPFGDTARRPAIEAATGWKKLWLRFIWLAIRNPANNVGFLLGVPYTNTDTIVYSGDQDTSDQVKQGLKFNVMFRGWKAIAFEFYYVKAWSKTRCLRVRLGWKLWDNPARLVHAINPFDSYTGKL